MGILSKAKCLLIAVTIASTAYSTTKNKEKNPVAYVNPYMGNISHLLVPTFPTIHLPNSFLRVYPERGDFTGDFLNGLPLVVTSHRGSSAFNLNPFQGEEKMCALDYHTSRPCMNLIFYRTVPPTLF